MRLIDLIMVSGLLFLAVEAGAVAESASQIVDGQSISCRHPLGKVKRAICGTPDILSLDKVEVSEYLRVLESYRTSDIYKYNITSNEQDGWINKREACQESLECLRSGYRARIKQLQEIRTETK